MVTELGRRCVTCEHAQRLDIESALRRGDAPTEIAHQFDGVSSYAVGRHSRNHLRLRPDPQFWRQLMVAIGDAFASKPDLAEIIDVEMQKAAGGIVDQHVRELSRADGLRLVEVIKQIEGAAA